MNNTKKVWSNLGWTVFTYLIIGIFIFPVAWMVLTGFKQEVEASTTTPLIFFRPTLDQFQLVAQSNFGAYLFNSLFASLVSTALALLLGIPTAYSMVFQMRTLLDNLLVLTLIYTAMNLPLVIWMARSFFMDLPLEVLEQAWLDGSSTFTSIVRIILPMSAPGLIATALLAVIFAWNDFFFAVALTYTEAPTLPILVSTFTSNEGLFLAKLSALATAIIIVPVALGIYAQRHLVHGLSGGALK